MTLEQYFSIQSRAKLNESPPSEHSQLPSYAIASPQNLSEGLFAGIIYDGQKRLAGVKLYDVKEQKMYLWYDNTNHKPYCFTHDTLEKIKLIEQLTTHPGLEGFERVEKYDALKEKTVLVTKIVAKDPLAIGGKPSGCIRDIVRAWEADIKYVENYIYDRQLLPGMPYRIVDGNLEPIKYQLPDKILQFLNQLTRSESEEYRRFAADWMYLLEYPVPEIRRLAFDIEVYSPIATRMPDSGEAEYPVICASLYGSDGKRTILLLARKDVEEGAEPVTAEARIEIYQTERELISAIFQGLYQYPFAVTFNGDDFDLRYLYHRAQRLGFARNQIPIEMGRDWAFLVHGVHIDLYKFFFNRSIQIYAFGQKYREVTLDDIAESLLGVGKKEIETPVPELSLSELAAYCFKDAEITYQLTSFDDDLVMKLVIMLSRISFMSIEDVTRQGVSGWIRSMLYFEHRRRNYLIPRPDEILELKGTTVTKAVIKGKKYKGAIVVEPVPGVHFNVSVLDFASLYPSIIKVWNLGYETVLCSHEDSECRSNLVPGTSHWVCKKKKAIESLLIGSLRDLRVNWYKPRSKDKDLTPFQKSLYKVVQSALKVILNAAYGVFGADKFALFCPPVAEATAAIGRYAITKTIEKAQSLNMEVFYGDTDSIFLGSPDLARLDELITWSHSELGMELEVDKKYRYLALSSRKKNYLGVHLDGNVDIKGLTGKKRHVPEFLKRSFYEMVETLGTVKSREEFQSAKERIKVIVKECYSKLKTREYSLKDLAFSIMINKPPDRYTKTTPQHVKAAQLLTTKGIEVKAGDLIAFVKVIGSLGVKPVQLANKTEIDTEKYVEYIRSTFDQVLDALGIDFEEIIGATKLESYFR